MIVLYTSGEVCLLLWSSLVGLILEASVLSKTMSTVIDL